MIWPLLIPLISAAASYAITKDPKQALIGGLIGFAGGGIGSLAGNAAKTAGTAAASSAAGAAAEAGLHASTNLMPAIAGAGAKGALGWLAAHPLLTAGGIGALSMLPHKNNGPPEDPNSGFQGFIAPKARTYNPISDEEAAMYARPGQGGEHTFFKYSEGGQVRSPTMGRADQVPAMLSGGEYVVPAKVVAALGDGNNEAGSAVLDRMKRDVLRKYYKK